MPDSAKERKAANYQANREKIRAQQREYREKNREKIRAQQREYYQQNREKLQAWQREYYQANREVRKERQRQYHHRNRETILPKLREYQEKNRERLAAYGLFKAHGIRPEDWATMWAAQDGRCYLCGGELDKDSRHLGPGKPQVHIDHDHSCCGEHRSCAICQRGLACRNCNVAIGILGDSPARMRQMADALEAAQREVEQRRAANAWVQLSLEDRV